MSFGTTNHGVKLKCFFPKATLFIEEVGDRTAVVIYINRQLTLHFNDLFFSILRCNPSVILSLSAPHSLFSVFLFIFLSCFFFARLVFYS